MNHDNLCIAVIGDHAQVNTALDGLLKAGFSEDQLSVVGKDHPQDEQIHGYATTGETMKFWGGQGAFWGGVMGMLAGAGMIFVPGIGPLIVAGPLVSVVLGGMEGSVGLAGIEALFGGLLHLGFSKDNLAQYEAELKAGKSLILVHGDRDEVTRAKGVLTEAGFTASTAHA